MSTIESTTQLLTVVVDAVYVNVLNYISLYCLWLKSSVTINCAGPVTCSFGRLLPTRDTKKDSKVRMS